MTGIFTKTQREVNEAKNLSEYPPTCVVGLRPTTLPHCHRELVGQSPTNRSDSDRLSDRVEHPQDVRAHDAVDVSLGETDLVAEDAFVALLVNLDLRQVVS